MCIVTVFAPGDRLGAMLLDEFGSFPVAASAVHAILLI